MKYHFLISALALLFGITPAHAQVNLSGMTPESSDSLQKNRIRYFPPGRGGSDMVWDFSGLMPDDSKAAKRHQLRSKSDYSYNTGNGTWNLVSEEKY